MSHGVPRIEQVLSSNGTITGYATLNGIQYLQLESSQVTPGFSGAPVFDEVTQRVVGMVAAIAPPDEYQRQGTTAFAVPTETLREIIPALQLSELCPYRSLDAFTEADAELFFGRERVVAKLLESLKRNPRFLAVLGPSGSGKSSVVGAGLIPALRKGGLSGSEKWGILSIRPGTQPFEQLASAGMSDPTHLVQAASDWLAAHPQNERLLILIDQFEELLVSTPAKIRAEFVTALADLLDSALDVSVLLTLRDDFYSRFVQEAEPLVGFLAASQTIIPPTLEEAELRQIIERPARDLGLVFAPGLVDAILADTRTADPSGRAIRSTVLPLLEFALTQLWERRVAGELTHDAYRAMGGVTGGLSQWADRAYYALDEGQRAIARRVFSELVTLGDETQGIADTRRVRSIAELTAGGGEATKTVLDALVTARLLVARHDESSGQDTVEIIHETLLREWGLLEGWLQDDRQFLLWREGLRAAQVAWQESGQDAGALLRGAPLAEAEDWLEKRGDDLGDTEKEYISKSVALRVRGERNRRWVMAGLALVAVLMAGLAFWGSSSATEAKSQAATAEAERDRAEFFATESRSRELTTLAQANLNDDVSLSFLLGVEAANQAYLQATKDFFTQAFSATQNVTTTLPPKMTTGYFAFHPKKDVLAIGAELGEWGGRIGLWDVSNPKMPVRKNSFSLFLDEKTIEVLRYSNSGKYLAIGIDDKEYRRDVLLLNMSNENLPVNMGFLGEPSLWLQDFVFSPDDNVLATSDYEVVNLWDLSNTQDIYIMASVKTNSYVDKIIFSPDGRYLLTYHDKEKEIVVWDISKPNFPLVISRIPSELSSFFFSKDGGLLCIINSTDYTTAFWDLSDITKPQKVNVMRYSTFHYLADEDVVAIRYSFDSSNEDVVVPSPRSMNSNSIAINYRGNLLAMNDNNGNFFLSELNRKDILTEIIKQSSSSFSEMPTALTYDKKYLLVLLRHRVDVWSTESKVSYIGSFSSSDINPSLEIGGLIDYWAISDTSNLTALSIEGQSLVNDDFAGVYLINISEPFSVQIIGKILLTNALRIPQLEIFGNQLFVEYCEDRSKDSDNCYQQVWNISNPSKPYLTTDLSLDKAKACQRAGRNFTKDEWEEYFPAEPYRITCEQWPAYGEPLTASDN